MRPIWPQVARLRSPNSQKMTLESSTSSAKYCMMVDAPEKSAESATPTSTMLSGRMQPRRENSSTTPADTMAPAKAKSAVVPMPRLVAAPPVTAGITTRMASVAPKAAPWEMPTVDEAANGFSSTLWSTQPAMASPAPEMTAHVTRGRRMACTAAMS